MTAFTRFAIRLYPQSWRERYGAELEALLEDMPSSVATTLDVLKGALRMHLSTWSRIRLMLMAALVGATVGVLTSFFLARNFASEISIRVSRASIGAQTSSKHVDDYVEKVIDSALNNASIETVVQTLRLPGTKGGNFSQTASRLKRSITVAGFGEPNGASRFVVRFESRDPKVARQVDEKLVEMIMDQGFESSLREKPVPAVTFMVLGAPTLVRTGLLHTWTFSAGGAALGIILFLLLRVVSQIGKCRYKMA